MPTSPSRAARSAAAPAAAAKPQQNSSTAKWISLLAIPLLAVALSRRRGPRVFTKAELAQYVDTSRGLKVAICGQVFDVTKGAEFYAKGAGYGFFAGRDASLAFATGNFKTNLTDNVSSLADAQLLELQNWVNDTYHRKYVYEGVVAGYFYDAKGQPTEDHLRFDERVGKAREAAARQARQLAGLERARPVWRVEGDDGVAIVELEPTTTSGTLAITLPLRDENVTREQRIEAWLDPGDRPWTIVGFAAGTAACISTTNTAADTVACISATHTAAGTAAGTAPTQPPAQAERARWRQRA